MNEKEKLSDYVVPFPHISNEYINISMLLIILQIICSVLFYFIVNNVSNDLKIINIKTLVSLLVELFFIRLVPRFWSEGFLRKCVNLFKFIGQN